MLGRLRGLQGWHPLLLLLVYWGRNIQLLLCLIEFSFRFLNVVLRFSRNILVCKHLKGFTDSRIILKKSRTVASHAKKSTYTKFFYYSGWIYFYYCYDLLWVWGDSVWAEYYSKKWFFISWLNWHFVFFLLCVSPTFLTASNVCSRALSCSSFILL